MNNRAIIILSFLIFSWQAQAQLKKSEILLKISPTSALNFSVPTIETGVELILKGKIGISGDYAWKLPFKFNNHVIESFSKSRYELRYYTNAPADGLYFFIGAEYLSISQLNQIQNSWYENSDGVEFSFQEAKDIHCYSIKSGINFELKKILVEFNGGLGIRNKAIRYTSIMNPVPSSVFKEWWISTDRIEGKNTSMHIALQLKVGYRLIQW